MEPLIHSSEGRLAFEPALPAGWKGKILSGSDPWYYEGAQGRVVIQKFRDQKFSILYAVCDFFEKVKLLWKEEPLLRLQYILDGRLRYTAGANRIMKLRAGQMNGVWAPGRETSANFSKGRFEIFQVAFTIELVQELLPHFPDSKELSPEHLKRWTERDYSDQIFELLNATYTGEVQRFFYKTRAGELLLSFVHPFSTAHARYSDDVRERIYQVDRKIMGDLNHHYTIEELVAFSRLPEGKLLEAYKEIFGKSMFDRYKEAKLEKAKKYLLETDVQVKALYEMVGYESYTGFVDAFKQRFGISPLKFRKKYRPFD